jgi:hypothetical protein
MMHDHSRNCLRCGVNPRDIGSSFCDVCKEQMISGKPMNKLPVRPKQLVEPTPKPKVKKDTYASQWKKSHPEPVLVPEVPILKGPFMCHPCKRGCTTFCQGFHEHLERFRPFLIVFKGQA